MKLPVALLGAMIAPFAVLAADPNSIVPTDSAGKPLNLGFEDGSLAGWTATGNAWTKQPIKGDLVASRRTDMRSEHVGQYWIGGFEAAGDDGVGTLTSVPFKVTQSWGSFLVGGGDWPETRVEIITKDDGKVIHVARGVQKENLARSVVDLRKIVGREIFIRLVDERKGAWGHVNFDDFVFHGAEPKFVNVAPQPAPKDDLKKDDVKFAGLSPAEAVKAADLPAGFEMTMFAAEPDIVNPISFCIDDRGRLWVVEGYTYPQKAKDGEGKDRIIVFEDKDGDGKAETRTVFMEKLNLVSGIEVGFGGVWIGAAPNLMFIPMQDGDTPKPAGEPKILLDGWGYQDTHETLNTFHWGPDGWLYGCHGVFTQSNVGKQGAPDSERTRINAGFWRYHPTRHQFEVFAEGTSNPWGIDFDEHGQFFAEACVIPHLFHVIQGARYQRQAGQHFNPNTYDDIKTIADHRHYLGANPHGGNGKSDSAGGGHAHAGLLIPQGTGFGEWTGRILMGNIHGQRINADVPERKGTGFVGHHGPDLINFNDRASQVVDIRQGPDGAIYMIDWYDLNQCHSPKREVHEYTTGRIYRVKAKGAKSAPIDLAKQSDTDLAASAVSNDQWLRTHARRLLQERKTDVAKIRSVPKKDTNGRESNEALYALWAEHVVGGDDDERLNAALKSSGEYERAWAIQFAAEDRQVSPAMRAEFARLAKEDKSAVVQLYLASAAQRLPLDQRLPILEPLLAKADASDQNLPLMLWYALEPVVGANGAAAATLLPKVQIPQLQEYIARRMASTASR
jgi:putative membrane-bound dehydrogenase-like protein